MKYINRFSLKSLIILGLLLILTWSCKKENPATITTLTVTEIIGNTAVSGGNITDDGGASVITRGIVWSTTENPTMNIKEGATSDGIGDGQFESNLTGLSPGTTYYVRAYAVNSAGTAYGYQEQFTTAELASVTTAETTDVSFRMAKTGGNVTYDGGAQITARGVVWGKSYNPTIESNVGITTDGSGTGIFISELTKLNPGTSYYVRAYATNQEGTSYGNQLDFTTIGAAPEVTTKNATDITSTSVVLSGTVNPNGLSTIATFEYGINKDYGSEGDAGQSPVSGDIFIDVSRVITGLSPGTTYHFRVKAENEVGITSGNDMTFKTLAILPSVTITKVSKIKYNSARSEAEMIDNGGATVTSRGVVWSISENPTISNNDGITYDGFGMGQFTSEITGLLSDTKYYIRAYATNSVGTGYGDQRSFETMVPDGDPCSGMPTFTDPRDGNIYNTVNIGGQCLMKENLKYLPFVSPSAAGSRADPHYYVFDYQGTSVSEAKTTDNYKNYGVLYNWPAAMNRATSSGVRGVCPAGWHLPSDAEWELLVDYLIDEYEMTNDMTVNDNGVGNALKSCRQVDSPLGGECATSEHPRWNSFGIHYGTDEFGFSALPGGLRFHEGNLGVAFYYLGGFGYWWSSTEDNANIAFGRGISQEDWGIMQATSDKQGGLSVRCILDD